MLFCTCYQPSGPTGTSLAHTLWIQSSKNCSFLLLSKLAYLSVCLFERNFHNFQSLNCALKGSFFYFLFFLKCGPFLKSLIEFLVQCCFCFMFWLLGWEICGILAPQPGIEPTSPVLEGEVLTTRPSGSLQGVVIRRNNTVIIILAITLCRYFYVCF